MGTRAAGGVLAVRPGRRSPGGLAYATRVRTAPVLTELTTGEFLASLDDLAGIYAAAMAAPPQHLPGRRMIMERHAGYPGFRAIAAVLPPSGPAPASPAPASPAPAPPLVVGFAYGFRGQNGQWWHDLVRTALADRHGRRTARGWMTDSFEVAEVHVHPAHQGRGTGHAMLLRLTQDRPEHTAMLSTMDADTSAHRLYLGVGFTDLLPGFLFPGASEPYTIMGAPLPLPGSRSQEEPSRAEDRSREAEPSRDATSPVQRLPAAGVPVQVTPAAAPALARAQWDRPSRW